MMPKSKFTAQRLGSRRPQPIRYVLTVVLGWNCHRLRDNNPGRHMDGADEIGGVLSNHASEQTAVSDIALANKASTRVYLRATQQGVRNDTGVWPAPLQSCRRDGRCSRHHRSPGPSQSNRSGALRGRCPALRHPQAKGRQRARVFETGGQAAGSPLSAGCGCPSRSNQISRQ